MVGTDEIFDYLRKLVLLGQFDTIGDVADNHLCTLFIAEALVWVHACLILGKECRVYHFADVVVQSTCTYKLTVCAYLVGRFCCEIGHLQRMLESARGYF